MAPNFFDPHVCCLPSTADVIGREMDFECRCGRRWRLEHYLGKDGSLLGPSWVLLQDEPSRVYGFDAVEKH
jgi:hypothetical protein